MLTILVETLTCTESAPVLTLDMARGLSKNGVTVYIVINSRIENLEAWRREFDDTNIYLWEDNICGINKLSIPLNIIRMRRKFNKVKFDYIITNGITKKSLLMKKCLNAEENIAILHDVIPHSSTHGKDTQYINNVIKKADNIMVLSKIFIPIVSEQFNKKTQNIFYMRHGLMEYPVNKTEFEQKTNDYAVNFLFFGRIDGYKGLHVLARAYGKLVELNDNISLTVAGNGDFSEYAKEFEALKNVSIINKYISDSELAFLFSKPNTVVVLPYTDATQSGVIGIAYNYLTPIIASDTGGLKEQLFDGEAGIFVKPNDAEDLFDKMLMTVNNRSIYEEQKRLMEKTYKKMTWEYITGELAESLSEHKNK